MSLAILALVTVMSTPQSGPGQWKIADGPLRTRWAKDVKSDKPLSEYPRPQMTRKNWLCLNGLWGYAIAPIDAPRPKSFGDQILVPYPIESALSGVMKPLNEKSALWYHRVFGMPKRWKGRTLLHFQAVDFQATVWVNDKEVGSHSGGYDAFTFDITDALRPGGENELFVKVTDPTDQGFQPRGKQVQHPGGIFYTPTSGIWQTVWLEPVPETHFESIRINADPDSGKVTVSPRATGSVIRLTGQIMEGQKVVATGNSNGDLVLEVKDPKLWSPDSPYLYNLKLSLLDSHNQVVDEVQSYCGFRKVGLGQDSSGRTRITLNGKITFMVGPLDQGFWPDGIYTAPTDEALRYDIEMTKKLGFNTIRKHVKVEPQRWYYWADKLGILVWQDMPSSDRYIGPSDPDLSRSPESASEHEKELKALVEQHYNSPAIVQWVVFNEGWGQYDTPRIVDLVKSMDPTRLVDDASGWADRKVGDVIDWHVYPGPGSPDPEPTRAAVLGEFGGLGLPIPEHMWQKTGWGYQSFKTRDDLTDSMLKLFANLHLLIGQKGLSAAIYTQTTDCETEVNGLMTYDREMVKADQTKVRNAVLDLFTPPPSVVPILPTSEVEGLNWQFTTVKPPANWAETTFDDSAWQTGKAGFGTEQTPGAVVRTVWNTADIWIRRGVQLPSPDSITSPQLLIHHDEDAEIYLDGRELASITGYTTSYNLVPIDKSKLTGLKSGRHIIAVHCHQTTGGQYIDVGLADLKPPR